MYDKKPKYHRIFYHRTRNVSSLFLENLDVLDPVFVIDDLFLKEDTTKYLKKTEYKCGRKRYNSIDLLKTVLFGFVEEVYVCEDCSNCPHAEKCKTGDGNRTTSLNRELTAIHEEVLANLESTHGALLRMNRSIQSEGTFGIIKQDRNYRRIARKGKKAVTLEILLISTGFNLYKFHNKLKKSQKQAA